MTTSIEWTATVQPDGTVTKGATWNPVTGCTEVSPGCDRCYARVFAERFRGVPGNHFEQGFDLKMWPDRLLLPYQWKKPRKIFVNSMSDLFHKDIPDAFILNVFSTMILANHHTYQVLTKRPSRLINTGLAEKIMNTIFQLTGKTTWPAHIWLGVSVENQDYAWRVDALRHVPAPVLFLSCEPLLGPLQLNLESIGWVIAGSESGHGARPMDEDWVRGIRDQCVAAEVAFFYKQKTVNHRKVPTPELDGVQWKQFPVIQEVM